MSNKTGKALEMLSSAGIS